MMIFLMKKRPFNTKSAATKKKRIKKTEEQQQRRRYLHRSSEIRSYQIENIFVVGQHTQQFELVVPSAVPFALINHHS